MTIKPVTKRCSSDETLARLRTARQVSKDFLASETGSSTLEKLGALSDFEKGIFIGIEFVLNGMPGMYESEKRALLKEWPKIPDVYA